MNTEKTLKSTPGPSDPELRKLFDDMPETVRKFIGKWHFAESEKPGEYPSVKGIVVIPVENDNSHDYPLHLPVQYTTSGNGNRNCLQFGSKTMNGNNVTRKFSSIRVPCLEEIVAMLCARNKTQDW